MADIAQAVQEKLDGYKADKRDLGSVSVLVITVYHLLLDYRDLRKLNLS